MTWLIITIFVLILSTLSVTVTGNVGICPSNTSDVNVVQMSGIWNYISGNNFGPDLRCIKTFIADVDHKMQITKTGRLLSNNQRFNATETLSHIGGGWFFMRISKTGTKYSLNILGTDYSSYLVIAYCNGEKQQHALAMAAVIAARSPKPTKETINKARDILHKYNISDEHFIEYEQEGCTT